MNTTPDKPPGIEGLKAANTIVAQVITVSAALLAFTVTFIEKFTPKENVLSPPWSLKASWACFAVTIVLGFWTLMAVAGTLHQLDSGEPETNPRRLNIRIPAGVMLVTFLIGVLFLIGAGWTVAGRPD